MTSENQTSARPARKRLWLFFFVLFFFWYMLLCGFDRSSLPGPSVSQENAGRSDNDIVIRSNNSSQVISDVNLNPNDNENEPPRNVTTDTETEMDDLEKEVEPLLPKYEEEDKEKKRRSGCGGRYIYVQDLPSRFNSDYIKDCKLLNKWHNMCPYFSNGGLGERLSSSCWYVTHQFSLDVIFHSRMQRYDCLTNDSSKAAAIYVPYYPGLDVSRFLWDTYNASVKDADLTDLFSLLRSRPQWRVMDGRDHFLVSGRITWDLRRSGDADSDWGSSLMVAPESQKMTMITIESSPWHPNDFAIPYPTYFHPSSDAQVREWQGRMRRQRRRSLFCFAGAPRPNMEGSIRGEIMAQCGTASKRCKMVHCKDDKHNCLKPANLMRMFQGSVFCLQPSGDSFTRRSTFDSILAGCIPVFFSPASAYVQYLWHLPSDFGSYSVLIPEGDVKTHKVSIDRVLSRIPASRVAAMREKVIKLIPNVIYADHRSRLEKIEDAFDLAIRGVVQRVDGLRREMKERRNSSAEFDPEFSWKYYAFGTTKQHEWDNYFKRDR
ncbi:Exostosin family protein [Striga hermonthica]|uniref:Exostosin family protein n=1 Tax=Striga hermonthica TaxID=68872 RepID=A0A9N7N897_STRHE|nr:Exostosin family protein [Striga hermonthica]